CGHACRNAPCTAAVCVNDYSSIASGGIHGASDSSTSCAIRNGGTAACWGYGLFGQIGDGMSLNRNVPTAVTGLTDATQIAIGQTSVCARRATGAVTCWGDRIGAAG